MYRYIQNSLHNMFRKLNIFTRADLNEAVNNNARISGGFITTGYSSPHKEVLMSNLRNWYFSKFEYSNVGELNTLKLEEWLFQWGRVAVVKYGDKYALGGYNTKTLDHNNEPVKIWFYPISQMKIDDPEKRQALKYPRTNRRRIFTVGIDAVIFQCGAPYLLNTKQVYTPFIKTDRLLLDLEVVYNQLIQNVLLSRSVLTLPMNIDKQQVESIVNELLSGSPVLGWGTDPANANTPRPSDSPLLDFKERIAPLIMAYQHIWDKIQTGLGLDTNSNPDKRERQITSEINVNNALSDGINKTELEYRKKALEVFNKTFSASVVVKLRSKEKLQTPIKEGENDRENSTRQN